MESQTPDIYKTGADQLHQLLETGPRNNTVTVIADYLDRGYIEDAIALYRIDGDKTASTIYQTTLEKILGCRLHQKHDCDSFFCKHHKL